MSKSFAIKFGQIDAVIGYLTHALDKDLEIKFDPEDNSYIIDGTRFSANFFAETVAKFSHYMNVTSRVMIKANDAYQESLTEEESVIEVNSLVPKLYSKGDTDGKDTKSTKE
jgi:hypothetical protein